MTLRLLTIATTLLVLAGVAAAQGAPPPPPPPGGSVYGAPPPMVHDGFHFRVHLGFGYTSMSASDAGNDITISGAGGAFGLSAGFAVRPNLIVYGELFDDIAVNPDVEVNGQSGTTEDVAAGVVGVGVGIKYYMMPANIYFAGTLAMAQLTVQENGEEVGESDFGPGLSLMAGKEWLVSSKWGVGLGAQLFFGSMPEKDADYSWTTTAFALVGTASYN
jgi:hypothetical protein